FGAARRLFRRPCRIVRPARRLPTRRPPAYDRSKRGAHMRNHYFFGLAAAFVLSACAAQPEPGSGAPPQLERPSQVLFWNQGEREAGFRAMDQITPHRVVPAGGEARPLSPGEPLDMDVDGFMRTEKVAGLLVLQDGRVRLERYGLDFGPQGRWTSFSVAKSVTSTLVGAAIADGHIESLQTPITRYLPELA